MKPFSVTLIGIGAVALFVAAPAQASQCPQDSVEVGKRCVDTYEASVWTIDPDAPNFAGSLTQLRTLAQGGDATEAKLLQIGGIKQVGAMTDDYGAGCPDTGNGCRDFFAVSIPGVRPSRFLTWFQATAVCRNAGKELPTSATWQAAALGTPDPGTDDDVTDCKIDDPDRTDTPDPTGSREKCVSDVGAFDMVGNVEEWVADWIQDNSDHDRGSVSTPRFGNDSILGIDEASDFARDPKRNKRRRLERFPAALRRGGSLGDGSGAGVFALSGGAAPSVLSFALGFRCARQARQDGLDAVLPEPCPGSMIQSGADCIDTSPHPDSMPRNGAISVCANRDEAPASLCTLEQYVTCFTADCTKLRDRVQEVWTSTFPSPSEDILVPSPLNGPDARGIVFDTSNGNYRQDNASTGRQFSCCRAAGPIE